jgi:hypothetical protein
MTEHNDPHAPSPEFVAALKRELLRTNRAELMFEAPRRWNVRRFAIAAALTFGAVLTLAAGLVVGASTGFASVEVLDARKRESELASMATSRQLAALRLELAQANYNTVEREVAAGTASRAELRLAKQEVDSMQAYVARVDVDIAARRTTVPPPRPRLAILSDLPMRRALTALACAAVAAAPGSAQNSATPPQQGIPIVEVSPVIAASKATIGTVFGVREVSDGRVLVNDPTRKQVVLFDAALATATVVIDSVPGTAKSYPGNVGRLSRYLGDSSIFGSGAQPIVVLDGLGQIVRAIAPPQIPMDMGPPIPFMAPEFTDPKGRLYTRGATSITRVRSQPRVESTALVRADLDARTVDFVGKLRGGGAYNRQDPPINGRRVVTSVLQPVPTVDAWTVLSDGTLAIVRGEDYHVDWMLPDGTKDSTARLPFDWRKLSDADKQRMIDSARLVSDSMMLVRNKRVGSVDASGNVRPIGGFGGDAGAVGGGRSGGGGPPPNDDAAYQRMDFPPLSEIPDFYPPVHRDAAMADLAGNLWILPTTSAQSQRGELVYDVVNPKRGLFARVRMPIGRSIVGFGEDGVLYLQSGDRRTGFHIERVKVEIK